MAGPLEHFVNRTSGPKSDVVIPDLPSLADLIRSEGGLMNGAAQFDMKMKEWATSLEQSINDQLRTITSLQTSGKL